VEYIATCSWDKHIRVYPVGGDHDKGQVVVQASQTAGDGGDSGTLRAPANVFPPESSSRQDGATKRMAISAKTTAAEVDTNERNRDGGGDDGCRGGHSADILAIAHCGFQQVATGGFDGTIFLWGTESGNANFSMRPSDHDISQVVDEVSSIGGLTSVAGLMANQRKNGLLVVDGESESSGYLDRMEDLLAVDDFDAIPRWDGREYFAEERMGGEGGSDDGSDVVAAANTPIFGNGGDDAEGSVEEETKEKEEKNPHSKEDRRGAAAAASAAAKQPSAAKPSAAVREGDVAAAGAGGRTAKASVVASTSAAPAAADAPPWPTADDKNEAMSLPDAPERDSIGDGVSRATAAATDVITTAAAAAPNRTGNNPFTSAFVAHDDAENAALPPTASEKLIIGHAAGAEEVEKHPDGVGGGDGDGEVQTNVNGKLDGNRGLGDNDVDKKAQKGVDSAVAHLESAASHSVDCLLYIRCHRILVSGSASGELHVWDVATGTFLFGAAARQPDNAGISTMASNEGCSSSDGTRESASGGGGGGGGDGSGDGSGGAGAGAGAGDQEVANLVLYTASEEGFVKTWKLGEGT
ncbi:unnamed protein product, partial [Sphacelaria rigidula]